MQMQQPLPAFALGSVYLDLKILQMQIPYFAMNMKKMKKADAFFADELRYSDCLRGTFFRH